MKSLYNWTVRVLCARCCRAFHRVKSFFHEKRLPRQWLVFFLVFFNTRMITDRTGLHVVIFPLQIGTAGYSLQAC